jgi:hypothetical protein
MKREKYLPIIRDRIINSEPGSVFVPSDFKDVANREVVKKGLLRLNDKQLLRRIMRGVYEYPEYSSYIKEYISTSPNKVAQALARNYGWTITPFGDTALNLMNLSTQVPATWIYVSDGTYKTYNFGSVKLQFKKTNNKEISGLSPNTALVIQALKALGQDSINHAIKSKISRQLTADGKTTLLAESQYATSWIYEAIKDIAKAG